MTSSLDFGFRLGGDAEQPDDTGQEEDGANDEHLLRARVTCTHDAVDDQTRYAARELRIFCEPPESERYLYNDVNQSEVE